jgi:hypothetical protein
LLPIVADSTEKDESFKAVLQERLVIVDSADIAESCKAVLQEQVVLTCDCEGFDLSRFGCISVIQFGTETGQVFLLDFLADPRVIALAKELLESDKALKIIHDARMDSDAMFHLHGITMCNVHDTQAYHAAITGKERVGLTDTLLHNQLPVHMQDNTVYKANPRYWLTRPMTKEMIDRAESDMRSLFLLRAKQLTVPEAVSMRAILACHACVPPSLTSLTCTLVWMLTLCFFLFFLVFTHNALGRSTFDLVFHMHE